MEMKYHGPTCVAGNSIELASVSCSAAETYNEGWRDGLTAAANIFDKWYRNNCITAGATNAIELASRLFKESNLTRDEPPNAPDQRTGATKL